ncbi:DUF2141 domain-containing protein [Aquimarina sp. 2201CG5-10]|uniref:DUF2141 domain-containing protein n=1 Tax=Aquimarina callyspongiae TaxID=3098150 RepID=UPI002AB43B30|nr:DUF2141 domain-containing protein [Aquimarina sp. 2201CG5-10]MDY8137412.1 DUF2141 domain-containing protein [Aquimarina sp. 2201CG5-10]
MKTLVLFLALTAINFITNAQDNDNTGITITVTVPNVSNAEGAVLFGLYDEATFMKAAPIKTGKSEIIDGVAKVTFTNIPAGEYGITCVHDVNNNQRMDFEENGMPKESYGVSNNNMTYGPPMWTDAKFTVGKENMEMDIRL